MKEIENIGAKMGAKMGTISLVLILIVATIVLMPQASAKPQYLVALQTIYGIDSCTSCHTDPNGGKSLTDYGSKFKAQPNYKVDPNGALQAIGVPPSTVPVVTTTNVATPTVIATQVETPTITATQIATPTITATQIATPTVVETTIKPVETTKKEKEANEKEEETSEKEETYEKSPGFDIIAVIGIVSIIYTLRRYKIER